MDDDLALHVKLSVDFDSLWELALKLTGCVGCARLDLAQRLALAARAKGWEITGGQDEEPPRTVGSDGTKLSCEKCDGSGPAVGFFKPETDEFL